MHVTAQQLKKQYYLNCSNKSDLPVVTFTSEAESAFNGYFTSGMKARLLEVDKHYIDVIKFSFSFMEFKSHNSPLERKNYRKPASCEESVSVRIDDNMPYFILDNFKIHFALGVEEHMMAIRGLETLKRIFEKSANQFDDNTIGGVIYEPSHPEAASANLETAIRALESMKK
jgi:hypothetical protein